MLTRDLIKALARAWYGREIDDAAATRTAATLSPLLVTHGSGPATRPFADEAAGFGGALMAGAERKADPR
ncbi:MAG: hypothetical protein EXQ86_06860 [Rhodospirillales bacterium]|nr:hypothetical protein [Rhodospirillales bacterium]